MGKSEFTLLDKIYISFSPSNYFLFSVSQAGRIATHGNIHLSIIRLRKREVKSEDTIGNCSAEFEGKNICFYNEIYYSDQRG